MQSELSRILRRRGFVLVTTLSMMIVLFMMAVLLTDTAYNSLRVSSSFYQSEQALQAANAGLVWAQAQMQQRRTWMSPGTQSTYSPMSRGSVTVTQTDYKAVGEITSSTGQLLKFVISFNPANTCFDPGTADAHGLPGMPYTSINLLSSPQGGEVLRNNSHFRSVSPYSAHIVVQGMALDGQNNLRAVRYVEASFRGDMTTLVDSVAFAGKNMLGTVEPGGMWNITKADGVPGHPGIRSMGDVLMYSESKDQFNAQNGQVHLVEEGDHQALHVPVLPSPSPSGSPSPSPSSSPPAPSKLSAPADFSSASSVAARFPVVAFANAYDPTKVASTSKQQIQAGAYVYWGQGTNQKPIVKYYPDLSYDANDPDSYDLSDQVNNVITRSIYDPDTGETSHSTYTPSETVPSAGLFDSWQITLDKPTEVVPAPAPSASPGEPMRDLSILKAKDVPNTLEVKIKTNPSRVASTTLYSESGSITINGSITGVGSIVTGGDLSFVGQSVLTPTSGSGLTLYSKRNITMRPSAEDESQAATGREWTVKIMEQVRSAASGFGGLAGTPDNASVSVKGEKFDEFVDRIQDSTYTYTVNGKTESTTFGKYLQGLAGTTGNGAKALIKTALVNNCTVSGSKVTINVDTENDGSRLTPLSSKDQAFFGMVYSWGDFRADVGSGNTVTVQGALVAWGNNPENYKSEDRTTYPGEGASGEGGGTVSLKGRNINFIYDPSFLGPLSEMMMQTRTILEKKFWATW